MDCSFFAAGADEGRMRLGGARPFRASSKIVLTTNDCLGNHFDKDFFFYH